MVKGSLARVAIIGMFLTLALTACGKKGQSPDGQSSGGNDQNGSPAQQACAQSVIQKAENHGYATEQEFDNAMAACKSQ